MYKNILGYKIDNDIGKEVDYISSLYMCTFNNCKSFKELELAIKDVNVDCTVAIDIDNTNISNELMFKFIAKYKYMNVFFVSRIIDEEERVRWYNFGIDGYILKPFHPAELLIRSSKKMVKNNYIFEDENFKINFKSRQIYYLNKKINVQPKIFDVIVYFVDNPNKLVTRQELMSDTLGVEHYLSDKYINNIIGKIRQLTTKNIIKTIRGKGYVYINKK